MASAVNQLIQGYGTSEPVSYYDFYNAYGRDHTDSEWIDADPDSLSARINNFFYGTANSAKIAYETYLSEYEFRKNQQASAKANQETWSREDSQVRRLMEDYQRAGVNPYLILNSGNLSGGVVSSQSQKPSYKKNTLKEKEIDSKLMNTAVKVLALLLLKKAL